MSVNPYIEFNGNCREAVAFYTQVFGVTEKAQIMTWGEMPADPKYPLPEEDKNLVMHTELILNGSTVMFSDRPASMPILIGNNISLIIMSKDIEEIEMLFNKMKVGGTVAMELQETFWSKSYGFLTDKYGIPWQFIHDSKMMGM